MTAGIAAVVTATLSLRGKAAVRGLALCCTVITGRFLICWRGGFVPQSAGQKTSSDTGVTGVITVTNANLHENCWIAIPAGKTYRPMP